MKKVCKLRNVIMMIFCLIFTMMPVTALAAQPGIEDSISGESQTTLTFYYKDKNNSGAADLINIKSVKYDSNADGVNVSQGYKITIDDKIFGDKDKSDFDASDYVPDWITDMDDIVWELNDKGDGQQTILIEKGKANEHAFHYKKGGSVPPPAPTLGGITITKEITGDVPETDATFTFSVLRPDVYSNEVTITGEGSTTISGLAPGTYTITEEDAVNYTEPDHQDVVVTAGTIAAITFTNIYTAPENPPVPTLGSITITKAITGDIPETAQVFTFDVTGPGVYTDEITITGEGSTTIGGLIPGTYQIAEKDVENYTEPGQQEVIVEAGTTAAITFTNSYKKPAVPPDKAKADVTKTVAEYDGENLPVDSAFTNELKLNALGRSVIFKITLSCNEEWVREERSVVFSDIFGGEDVTEDILVLKEGSLVKASSVYYEFPHRIFLNDDLDTVFYFVKKMDKAGAYTNTANIFEYKSEIEHVIVASSSAVVVVSEPSDDGPSGSTGGHHHHSSSTVTQTTSDPGTDPGTSVTPVNEPVPVNELDDIPKTGDDTPILPLIMLSALSVLILSLFSRKGLIGPESK